MASFWDRFLNLFDDHLEANRQAEVSRATVERGEDSEFSAERELLEKLRDHHYMALTSQGVSVQSATDSADNLARIGLAQMQRDNPGFSMVKLLAGYENEIQSGLASIEAFRIEQEATLGASPDNHFLNQLDKEDAEAEEVWQIIKTAVNSLVDRIEGRQQEISLGTAETLAQLAGQTLTEGLAQQASDIQKEWQRDLELAHTSQHDLESYFAGRIDQHNTLIEMAVEAHPELQQTLPPPINFQQLREELQQQASAQNEQEKAAQQELAVAGYGISI